MGKCVRKYKNEVLCGFLATGVHRVHLPTGPAASTVPASLWLRLPSPTWPLETQIPLLDPEKPVSSPFRRVSGPIAVSPKRNPWLHC